MCLLEAFIIGFTILLQKKNVMSKAAFSIVNYQFDKVILDYQNYSNDDMQVAFLPRGTYIQETSEYELSFTTSVFTNKNFESPFLLIDCTAIFKFETETSFEDIPEFFYTNAIAILFPYVRAYASLITTQANVPGLILPTLNLAHLSEELKKETSKK